MLRAISESNIEIRESMNAGNMISTESAIYLFNGRSIYVVSTECISSMFRFSALPCCFAFIKIQFARPPSHIIGCAPSSFLLLIDPVVLSQLVFKHFVLTKPQSDLFLRTLDSVGAVADVAANVNGVIPTNGTRG